MSLSDILTGFLSGDGAGGEDDVGEGVDPDERAGWGSNDPSSGGVIYECRECGTTVTEGTTRCPACDSSAIAEYPVE